MRGRKREQVTVAFAAGCSPYASPVPSRYEPYEISPRAVVGTGYKPNSSPNHERCPTRFRLVKCESSEASSHWRWISFVKTFLSTSFPSRPRVERVVRWVFLQSQRTANACAWRHSLEVTTPDSSRPRNNKYTLRCTQQAMQAMTDLA